MFTGLIQDRGRFLRLERSPGQTRIVVETQLQTAEFVLGESIAVNGVCLTVVRYGATQFVADVSPESLQRTNLGQLQPGQSVNLERALRLCDRLGGHLVSGHVDAVGEITQRSQEGNAVRFSVRLPSALMRYVVEKGSIAIDGISLTVNAVTADAVSLAVIPHSLAETTLQTARVGTHVNIETDVLGRYVERLLGLTQNATAKPAGMSLEALARQGFLGR